MCLWQHCVNSKGYGCVTVNKVSVLVHRYALESKIGRALAKNELACHSCDQPKCYNPNHLWVGSNSDNMRDILAKGRRDGIKLTKTQVKAIKDKIFAGCSVDELVSEYGVSARHIRDITACRAWGSLTVGNSATTSQVIKGSANGNSRLTENKVLEIRRLLAEGRSQRSCAALLGVSLTSVGDIHRGRTWGHLS